MSHRSPTIPATSGQLHRLRRLRRIARLMDGRFGIPFTRFRFGLDSIVGLVPGGGDVATALVGLYIIHQARDLGASPATLRRMLANLGIDLAIGIVPVAGDVADLLFKANLRNIELLERDMALKE